MLKEVRRIGVSACSVNLGDVNVGLGIVCSKCISGGDLSNFKLIMTNKGFCEFIISLDFFSNLENKSNSNTNDTAGSTAAARVDALDK